MKQSQLFTRTSRECSADEVSVNSRLLMRAGFVEKEFAGVYSFLPLGWRVMNKIMDIIRQEIEAIGGMEVHLAALQSPQAWEASGRWGDDAMDVWFRTALKNGTELGLAPTHEEALARIMKRFVQSWRDLPAYPFQFQTKYRNETRAKSGILRTREFIMKDLYSFTRTAEELDDFYQGAMDAYVRIFRRLGIGDRTFVTWASGGSFCAFSHEFQTLCDHGEDLIYLHKDGKTALNREVFTDPVLAELGLDRGDFTSHKSIEVGNIFKLGTRFAEALELNFTDQEGLRKPVVMGSYGIGPARVMGTVVESSHDDRGIIWPAPIAPYRIHLLTLGKDAPLFAQSKQLCAHLESRGVEVLWDDRPGVSAGVKLADADLIGCPTQVLVGAKNLGTGKVEVKDRRTGNLSMVACDKVEDIIDLFGQIEYTADFDYKKLRGR